MVIEDIIENPFVPNVYISYSELFEDNQDRFILAHLDDIHSGSIVLEDFNDIILTNQILQSLDTLHVNNSNLLVYTTMGESVYLPNTSTGYNTVENKLIFDLNHDMYDTPRYIQKFRVDYSQIAGNFVEAYAIQRFYPDMNFMVIATDIQDQNYVGAAIGLICINPTNEIMFVAGLKSCKLTLGLGCLLTLPKIFCVARTVFSNNAIFFETIESTNGAYHYNCPLRDLTYGGSSSRTLTNIEMGLDPVLDIYTMRTDPYILNNIMLDIQEGIKISSNHLHTNGMVLDVYPGRDSRFSEFASIRINSNNDFIEFDLDDNSFEYSDENDTFIFTMSEDDPTDFNVQVFIQEDFLISSELSDTHFIIESAGNISSVGFTFENIDSGDHYVYPNQYLGGYFSITVTGHVYEEYHFTIYPENMPGNIIYEPLCNYVVDNYIDHTFTVSMIVPNLPGETVTYIPSIVRSANSNIQIISPLTEWFTLHISEDIPSAPVLIIETPVNGEYAKRSL